MRKWPTFLGYTVDWSLREFRKFIPDKKAERISFDSEQGQQLITKLQTESRNKLIPQSLQKKLPALYSQEDVKDPKVWVKFFYPDFHWTWWGIEFDGKDTFFGLVRGDYVELGYFNLVELYTTRGKLGLMIERDRFFRPCLLSEITAKLRKECPARCLV